MDITVSSPGSPGTSFTENVKKQIIFLYDQLEENPNFESLADLKRHLIKYGLNASYTRNILPFLQYCEIIKYENVDPFINDSIFTNIGKAYVDILKSIEVVKTEEDSDEKHQILSHLENIQETIYFQCLVNMMKNKECNYAKDFCDVLNFINEFKSIDSIEYLLIQYAREKHQLKNECFNDYVLKYRNNEISINVTTHTKNSSSGSSKSVNSFPYVSGNFTKAGVVKKCGNRFFLNPNRREEIDCALREVGEIWDN